MDWRVMEMEMLRLGLTEREGEVTRLVVAGVRTAQVAELLYLEQATVANHMGTIYRKAGIPVSVGRGRRCQLLRVLSGLPAEGEGA